MNSRWKRSFLQSLVNGNAETWATEAIRQLLWLDPILKRLVKSLNGKEKGHSLPLLNPNKDHLTSREAGKMSKTKSGRRLSLPIKSRIIRIRLQVLVKDRKDPIGQKIAPIGKIKSLQKLLKMVRKAL